MPAAISSVFRGIAETWRKLGRIPKLVVVTCAALAFLGCAFLAFNASKGPEYGILWSNLDPQDAGTIVSELEREGIPYELKDGGRTITVPRDQVYRTRLSLSAKGLPSLGIVGFESIDGTGIWATDFERKVQYVRALSGELARTIKSISGVEDARVHIVLPEPSVFVSQRQPATAAVLLKMAPLQEISSSLVRAITNLVARSVEGLTPENVTVVDSSGRLLSQHYQDEFGGVSGSAMELTFAVERELEKRLVALLSPVWGAGNVVCQVRCELNLDKVTTVDTVYTPDPAGAVRSSQEITESYVGTGTMPGGQAGGLEIPTYGTGTGGESQYQRSEVVRNYELNQRVTETTIVPGTIKRLSVAVLINRELDDDTKAMITESVSAALGLDPARQDTISVTGLLFDTSLAEKVEESLAQPAEEGLPMIYIYAIAIGLALLVGTVILLILARARRRRETEVPEVRPPAVPVAEEGPSLTPEAMARQRIKENIERLARSNPETVAALIKSWLLEDER